MSEPGEAHTSRTFGRRRGHRLSRRKQALMDTLLPRLRIDVDRPCEDLKSLFPKRVSSVALEIGFGAGEHLAAQAAANPDCGFVGCEVYVNGIASLLGRIADTDLDNIRIYDGDARDLLGWLPAASVDRAYVLFPDPWPKKRHAKRRLMSDETVAQLARAMRGGAELRLASDIPAYVRTALTAFRRSAGFEWVARGPADWRVRPDDWPETRYERKALTEGRLASYLRFVRRDDQHPRDAA